MKKESHQKAKIRKWWEFREKRNEKGIPLKSKNKEMVGI